MTDPALAGPAQPKSRRLDILFSLLLVAVPLLVGQQTVASTVAPGSAGARPATLSKNYAAREASAPGLEKFEGGDSTIIIGGTTLVVILLVVLILVLV